MFEVGSKVKGTTTKGRAIAGTVTRFKSGQKGAWFEVTQDDGKAYCTRAALLELA